MRKKKEIEMETITCAHCGIIKDRPKKYGYYKAKNTYCSSLCAGRESRRSFGNNY